MRLSFQRRALRREACPAPRPPPARLTFGAPAALCPFLPLRLAPAPSSTRAVTTCSLATWLWQQPEPLAGMPSSLRGWCAPWVWQRPPHSTRPCPTRTQGAGSTSARWTTERCSLRTLRAGCCLPTQWQCWSVTTPQSHPRALPSHPWRLRCTGTTGWGTGSSAEWRAATARRAGGSLPAAPPSVSTPPSASWAPTRSLTGVQASGLW